MITGTHNPIVGKQELYQFSDGLDIFNSMKAKYIWSIWKKQKNGSWLNITRSPQKMGQEVPFKFGEKVIGEEFKLQVHKATPKLFSDELDTKLAGEIIVVPTSSKVPKIDKVILFNGGAKDPNKASYKDTLIARAYCVAMFNNEVEFQLWEDDAAGPGHNAVINKNNQIPQTFKGRVNENGIAEVKISLLSNAAVLKALANKYMMTGDKNEGANHEYYVTASYAGKIQKASQVNVDVANPDYQPKPKDDSAKFPATNDSKTEPQPDPKGNIRDAYFVNDKNQKLANVLVDSHVKVQILSSNLIGKYIQYVVWEKDFGMHDEVFRSGKIKIPGDICTTGGFKITEKIFQKGIDLPAGDPDSEKQNYFLEIIVLDSTAESKKFGLDDKAGQPMEVVRSAAMVEEEKIEKKPSTCLCKEQFKDLIWGEKVSCEFRKKVVEICAELWGESRRMEMADGLMAVMNVETAGTFKAHQIMGRSLKDVNTITKDDFWLEKKGSNGNVISKTSRAVGLIQFTQDALEAIGEFTAGTGFDKLHEVKLKFAKMGEVNQLSYVKKYFEPAKDKIKTPADIYLQVFAPKGVGKIDSYILYKGGTEQYIQNASVDTKSTGEYKNDGDIQRSELLERFDASLIEGKNNKTAKFSCSTSSSAPKPEKPTATKDGMLSKYLSLALAIKSDTANRHKIDNTPSAAEKENLKHLGVNIYDKIYEKFNGNLRLTSVFRNETLNKKVGGSSTSQHRYGQAMDIQGTNGITNKQIFKYVKENLDYHQIIWEFGTTNEPSWVHVGYKPSGNKKINTRAVKISGKTSYKTFDLSI